MYFWSVKYLLIILLSLCGTGVLAHPLHLSITNIVLENGTLHIELKTFRDDWETAYFHYHSDTVSFKSHENRSLPWFSSYLKEQFRLALSKDGEPLPLIIDTISLEEENMQFRMRVRMPENAISLYLYQGLLTDIFPDQTNLVIFEMKGKQNGIKFDWKKREERLKLD